MTGQENLVCLDTNSLTSSYNPALLFDGLQQKWELSNDKELANFIGVSPSAISKIRKCKTPLSAGMLVRIHELTNVAITDIRALIGERRTRQFGSDAFSNKGRRAGD